MSVLIPARTIAATVRGVYAAFEGGFETKPVDTLSLTYAGIPGDTHGGLTRKSGAREPWYGRGTEMRNERQLSILGEEELAEVATGLGIDRLAPEWIGGNLLLSGIPQLSWVPPRTILMFPSGAAIRIDGDNGPCRQSGRAVAAKFPGRADLEFGFVKVAADKRGLVGWVEREGEVRAGDPVKVRIWPQRLYGAAASEISGTGS
jgi:hypothetical protein